MKNLSKSEEQFLNFLQGTLIPDLKDSGQTHTASDFERCVEMIESLSGTVEEQVESDIVLDLDKGESITFLDYTIQNSLNNDGLVLSKSGGKLYETHLGNFGEGTQDNIDDCKRYALVHFMLARPEEFATNIARKVIHNRGTFHEYFKLANVFEKEGLKMPHGVTIGKDTNFLIHFKGQPLSMKGGIS